MYSDDKYIVGYKNKNRNCNSVYFALFSLNRFRANNVHKIWMKLRNDEREIQTIYVDYDSFFSLAVYFYCCVARRSISWCVLRVGFAHLPANRFIMMLE